MMSKQQEFLEALKDPFQFAVRKACFDFHNDSDNHKLIYDLRIEQVNELQLYHIILITKHVHQQIHLLNDFYELLMEYVPSHVNISYSNIHDLPDGKNQRTFYAWDSSDGNRIP